MKRKNIVLVLTVLLLCIIVAVLCIWVGNRPAAKSDALDTQQTALNGKDATSESGETTPHNPEQGGDILEEIPIDVIPNNTSGNTGTQSSGMGNQQGGVNNSGAPTGTGNNAGQSASSGSNTGNNIDSNAGSSNDSSGQSGSGGNSGDTFGQAENTGGDAQQNQPGSTTELPIIPG
ncbi:MAG: hypothetical protein IJQ17_07165 [Oscillospiraceae bacterium]|nr:hypothetical protein [Oscillospiraceae bacterium]